MMWVMIMLVLEPSGEWRETDWGNPLASERACVTAAGASSSAALIFLRCEPRRAETDDASAQE
jgi:hypothetical protein